MAVKKRCIRCLNVMRNDGTKENPKWVCNKPTCVRYVPPKPKEEEPTPQETPSDDTTTPSTGGNE